MTLSDRDKSLIRSAFLREITELNNRIYDLENRMLDLAYKMNELKSTDTSFLNCLKIDVDKKRAFKDELDALLDRLLAAPAVVPVTGDGRPPYILGPPMGEEFQAKLIITKTGEEGGTP